MRNAPEARRGRPLVRRAATILALAVPVACTSATPTDPLDELPDVLHLEQPSLPSGSVSVLSGWSVADGAALELTIGSLAAPVNRLPDGTLLAGVPFFEPAPPPNALDLLLTVDGEPVARGVSALTVLPAPAAPGSAEVALTDLEDIATAWRAIGTTMSEPGVEDGWMSAALGALEVLLTSDEPGSLRSVLAEADPASKQMIDAWFASSGVLDALQQYGARLETITASMESDDGSAPPQRAPGDVGSRLPANTLAKRMQLQAVAAQLGQTVIAETSTEFGAYVGTAMGVLGLFGSVPGATVASVTGALLGVVDFVVNKLVVGLLPSTIDEVLLEIENTNLVPGDETIAFVRIQASNTPPPISLQDVISQTVSLLGMAPGGEAARNMEDVVASVAQFYILTMQSLIAAYAGAHPELNMDVTLASVPHMVWWANVLDGSLMTPVTTAPEIVTPLVGAIDWRADGDVGEATVYVRTATGPSSHRLTLPAGILYTGGAFGENAAQSNEVTLRVGGPIVLEVDFAETIARDGFNALEARAGYERGDGTIAWTEGIWIELTVDGGVVETIASSTDADGQFVTLARLDPGSERIVITVEASDDAGGMATATVEAVLESGVGRIEIVNIYNGWTATARAYAEGSGTDYQQGSDFDFAAGSMSGGTSLSASSGVATASMSASHSGDVELAVDSIVLLRARSQATLSSQAAAPIALNAEAAATATSDLHVSFSVHDNPVYLIIEGTGYRSGWTQIGTTHLSRYDPGPTLELLDYGHPDATTPLLRVFALAQGYTYQFSTVLNAASGAGWSALGAPTSATSNAGQDLTLRIVTKLPEGYEVD